MNTATLYKTVEPVLLKIEVLELLLPALKVALDMHRVEPKPIDGCHIVWAEAVDIARGFAAYVVHERSLPTRTSRVDESVDLEDLHHLQRSEKPQEALCCLGLTGLEEASVGYVDRECCKPTSSLATQEPF